jgi:hypothetical protein
VHFGHEHPVVRTEVSGQLRREIQKRDAQLPIPRPRPVHGRREDPTRETLEGTSIGKAEVEAVLPFAEAPQPFL